MNIYVIAYTKNNFGDDLFISMLVSRYKNVNFYINIQEEEYKKCLEKYNNITVISKKRDLKEIDLSMYDAIVYIGGSIFMEEPNGFERLKGFNEFIKAAKNKKIPFFYISSNFGPYTTQEYMDLAKDTFEHCEDVCFRDKYSYELFKDVKSVRYEPDLVLSYDFEILDKERDSIGISVIDLSIRKNLKQLENSYLDMLKDNIENYQSMGKKIYLFSFCKYEGDENTISKLKEKLENIKNVNIIKYNGNIDDFLKLYSKMEYMICARFHAMILSTRLAQRVAVMSYSKKMDNVIDDLNLPFNKIVFNNLKADTKILLEQFKSVEQSDLKDIVVRAKNQFEKLDKYIEVCEKKDE